MEGDEVPEGLNEWEQVQSPGTQITPAAAQSSELERMVIRENYLYSDSSVFPPSQHEGLQVPPQDPQALQEPLSQSSLPSSSVSSCSSSSDLQSQSGARQRGEIGGCLRLRLELLSSRVYRVASAVRCYASCKRCCWSFGSAAAGAGAALLLSLLYVRVRRWRRKLKQENNKDRLMLLIRQKDEKISQLTLQIAQMSELLSARRRVPVLRIG